MLNKKSMELSLNFLVIIIISITIFGFGILFISNLASEAEDLRDMTLDQIDQQISGLACEGSDRICIVAEKKKIQRGKVSIFGIKILNVLSTSSGSYDRFQVVARASSPIGYKKDNSPITSPALIINPPPPGRDVNINKNEDKIVGIGVQVPKDAPIGGTYIIDVEIRNGGNLYVPLQKLYVEVV
mgnify:CR=1 FL=1